MSKDERLPVAHLYIPTPWAVRMRQVFNEIGMDAGRAFANSIVGVLCDKFESGEINREVFKKSCIVVLRQHPRLGKNYYGGIYDRR